MGKAPAAALVARRRCGTVLVEAALGKFEPVVANGRSWA